MPNPYAAFCDDFYINMRLGSQMALPSQRETVLHFFEQIQRAYPSMTCFRKAEGHDFSLEEDRAGNAYRWVSLEGARLSAGQINPDSIEQALKLHDLLLQIAPHQLGVSPLEIDFLDVLFGFDLDFQGNQDEIVVESLYEQSPLACLLDAAGARPVDFQPTIMVALDDGLRTQARLDVITRTSSNQIRTGHFNDEAISVYLTVRRFWDEPPNAPLAEVLATLAARAEQLVNDHVIPRVVRPIGSAIASRS